MSMVTVEIDLAKNVFALHGVDETGKAVLVKPKVTRDQLVALITQIAAVPDRHGLAAEAGAVAQGDYGASGFLAGLGRQKHPRPA